MSGALTDPQLSAWIASYEAVLLPIALKLRGVEGAEVDDLMQEGRIAVWQCALLGVIPSVAIIYKRMLNWLRFIRNQTPGDYDDMLTLTDG